MKSAIIHRLKTAGEVLSGEALSRELGISRVAVWKNIRGLQEAGYNIVSSAKGYRLLGSPDALFPWEFPQRESHIHYFAQTTSTMDRARDLARKGCPHFTVVVADSQSCGRGRLKRSWISGRGGLYFTVVLRPDLPQVLCYRINFAASLVLARLIRESYNIEAGVKWPNDILVGDQKVVGILSEMETESDMVSFVNLGIGINVNNPPPSEVGQAASLQELSGQPISRRDLLATFLDQFETAIADLATVDIVSRWKQYTTTLNRDVKIVTAKETAQGMAVDVDESGALILWLPDGSTKRIVYGDCFHQ